MEQCRSNSHAADFLWKPFVQLRISDYDISTNDYQEVRSCFLRREFRREVQHANHCISAPTYLANDEATAQGIM